MAYKKEEINIKRKQQEITRLKELNKYLALKGKTKSYKKSTERSEDQQLADDSFLGLFNIGFLF